MKEDIVDGMCMMMVIINYDYYYYYDYCYWQGKVVFFIQNVSYTLDLYDLPNAS